MKARHLVIIALSSIAILASITFVVSKYVQPALSPDTNSTLALIVAAITGVAVILAAFNEIIELVEKLFIRQWFKQTKPVSTAEKIRFSDDVFVWSSSEPDGTGLPENSLPVTPLYVHRPEIESTLRTALLGTQIVALLGPSGVGKTYLASKVIITLQEKEKLGPVVYFDSQPEISTLLSYLLECSPQHSLGHSLDFLGRTNTLIVFDNFKDLTPKYSEFLHKLLTYTVSLRVLIIARSRIELSFPDFPRRVKLIELTEGFSQEQAALFLKKVMKVPPSDEQDFDKVYHITGQGLPRALAYFASTASHSERAKSSPLILSTREHDPLYMWARNVLEGLSKLENEIVEIIASMPNAIDMHQLMLAYEHLHPVRCLVSLRWKTHVNLTLQGLVDSYVIELLGGSAVAVHDSIRGAINLFPQRLVRAHQLFARIYLRKYKVRPYNPDKLPAQELNDKWNVIYHSILGGMYLQAADVLHEIYPFLLQMGFQDSIDVYLEELYRLLGDKSPWVPYYLACRCHEKGKLERGLTILNQVARTNLRSRMIVRVMTEKAAMLADANRLDEALALAKVNVEELENYIERDESYTLEIRHDPNLYQQLASNLHTFSKIYAAMGDNNLAEAYASEEKQVLAHMRVTHSMTVERIAIPH